MRDGMQLIVAHLRHYGSAATTDLYNGITYWTDEQLEALADDNSERLLVPLRPSVRGDSQHFTAQMPRSFWFETDSITVRQISNSETVPTTYVYAPNENAFIFSEELDCKAYEVVGKAINLNLALAALWEIKANQRYDYADFKVGQSNKIDLSQEYDHCVARAAFYRSRIIKSFSRSTGRWSS
jgi:hypothetical protein